MDELKKWYDELGLEAFAPTEIEFIKKNIRIDSVTFKAMDVESLEGMAFAFSQYSTFLTAHIGKLHANRARLENESRRASSGTKQSCYDEIAD